jgi:hypothetical protein
MRLKVSLCSCSVCVCVYVCVRVCKLYAAYQAVTLSI